MAYRFVFNPMDAESFKPVAQLPPRLGSDVTLCCSDWGLSMFESAAKAKKKFAKLVSQHPLLRKRLGTHLAEATLSAAHGICTEPTSSGHFDLHPAHGAAILAAFQIVEELP